MKHRALSFELFEQNLGSMGLRYPKQIKVEDATKEDIKDLKWEQIKWEEFGDDGNTLVYINMTAPLDAEIRKGVIVDIQLIQNKLYQVHISLAEDLRGIGLGTKIYRSLVEWLGHIYSGKGRRQNPIIDKVWSGLQHAPGVKCATNDLGDLCVADSHKDQENFIQEFEAM